MYQTLYNILRKERIEIPIIQRDYAQGREDKVYLRERLLGKMIKALQDKKGEEKLSLDFVYGTKEHGAVWPLDGQQRLTTLWLLHWYIAVRTDKLDSAKDWLSRFTYETRTTSRDFINSLCNLETHAFKQSGMKLVDYLMDQTWFYSKYNQDPTIIGMLRTLGGTTITNSEDEDIQDGIEEFLANDDCKLYWERLLSENCPITFLFKDMKDENLPLSDDLYIKMNARGKQLTDFENFKADLIGFAPDKDHPHDKLLDVKTASLMDNEWTDIFWKEASSKGVYKVDDIYFTFLRRYFLDRLIATTPDNVEDTQKITLYQDLYKGKKNYNGLKGYDAVLTRDTIAGLKNLFARWNYVKIAPYWDENSAFAFIPEYIVKETDKDGSKPTVVDVTAISQKERAVFHAVCCYFEDNESFDQENFKQWMRFTWNIVENSNINNEEAMIGAIRLFEELRPYSSTIIQFLVSSKKLHSSFAARQLQEERFKAMLVCGEHQAEWVPLLDKAEKMLFFKGNIACLLRHDEKEFVEDRDCFKTKLSHSMKYFGDKGIRNDFALPLTKALIRIAHRWDQIVEQYIFDTSAESWRIDILHDSENKYLKEVHTLLTTNNLDDLEFVSIKEDNIEKEKSENNIKKLFAETKFLEISPLSKYGNIVDDGSEWRLTFSNGVPVFFPYKKHSAYLLDWMDPEGNDAFRRNELLCHPNIDVDEENNPCSEGIFWDWRVFFNYNEQSYMWHYNNDIYLLNKQNNPKRRDSQHKNKDGDEFFCIHMNELPNVTQQGLLIRLTRLAQEAIE